MTILEALTTVRNCALKSPELATPQGRKALKVVSRKIAALERKRAWRESTRDYPDHITYPEHPLNKQ